MNFSKSFNNFMKFSLATAFIGVATVSSASATPISTVFFVNGTFENGATLAGTLDINTTNTTTSAITSADITISGINGIFTLDQVGSYNGHGVWDNVVLGDGNDTATLDLALAQGATNLVGYKGGALCGDDPNTCGVSKDSNFVSNTPVSQLLTCNDSNSNIGDPLLLSGTVSSAPEPGATTLLSAGLSALGLIFRRRFVKK